MLAVAHPEVLSHDWLPPSLIGRAKELARLQQLLGDPLPELPTPWVAVVRGPPGSGSSAVARIAARRLLESYRRERPAATPPLLVAVRVRWCAGTQGVATTMLQSLDEGFSGRGFSVVEIVAGFLRRLARAGRPAVVVLDDLGPDTPDLAPILRGLLAPLRFLPEGVDAAPAIWTVLAGEADRSLAAPSGSPGRIPTDRVVTLPPMDGTTLRAILADRCGRALGRTAPPEWVGRLAARAESRALGASRTLDLLRRELLGPTAGRFGTVFAPRGAPPVLSIEPRVLEALARAGDGHLVPLADLRAWEARLAREEGERPLPATTMWRRLVHLEAAGLVRREVRPGGPGGTLSRLEILRPVTEWPVPRVGSRIRRGVGDVFPAGAVFPPPRPPGAELSSGFSRGAVAGRPSPRGPVS